MSSKVSQSVPSPPDDRVKRIQDRGGKVVFVRFPSGEDFYRVTERFYPKQEYWDRFAALTSAQTWHFRDVEGLSNFPCPDGVHLGSRDAIELMNIGE